MWGGGGGGGQEAENNNELATFPHQPFSMQLGRLAYQVVGFRLSSLFTQNS